MKNTGHAAEPSPAQPGAVDMGRRPRRVEQVDPALALGTAEQEAMRDRGVFDAPSLLANTARLPFTTGNRAWLDYQVAEAEARTLDSVQAVKAAGLQIKTGRDDDASFPGQGSAALELRVEHTEQVLTAAESALDVADKRLGALGAPIPSDMGRGSRVKLYLRVWGLTLLGFPFELLVVTGAVGTVLRTERVLEALALAAIALFGLAALPKIAGSKLHANHKADKVRANTVAAAGAGLAWFVLAGAVTGLRVAAAWHDSARSSGGPQFNTGTGTPAVPEAAQGLSSLLLWAFFFGVVAAFAVANFIVAWLSPAQDQLEYVRAHRARQTARDGHVVVVQAKSTLTERMAFNEAEADKCAEAGEQYTTVVLPTLAARRTVAYHQELARQVNDPGFTDALRLVDMTLPSPTPVVAARAAVPSRAEDLQGAQVTS